MQEFYDHVNPRQFEQDMRNEFVSFFTNFVQKVWPNARVYAFGSFKSGLYLPTADMDVAICSDQFIKYGVGQFNTKQTLFRFRSILLQHGIALHDEIEVISGAKVPIVKFVDRRYGLKIDVCFERFEGVS